MHQLLGLYSVTNVLSDSISDIMKSLLIVTVPQCMCEDSPVVLMANLIDNIIMT